MKYSDPADEIGLPSTDGLTHRLKRKSIFALMFGGEYVERRSWMIGLAISMIVLVGFILGTLFTMGVLTGMIEIDPKSIKSILKSIVGKS